MAGRLRFARGWRWPSKSFLIAVALMIATLALGPPAVLAATYYESRASLEFSTGDLEFSFSLMLKADGPLTTYKDVLFRNAQLLAFPRSDVASFELRLYGEGGLWRIEINRTVALRANESANVFFDGRAADGRIQFRQPGQRNVSAVLWVYPGGYRSLQASNPREAIVDVLPKEADDSWNAGRLGLVALVVSAALFAIPVSVRELRDLYLGRETPRRARVPPRRRLGRPPTG